MSETNGVGATNGWLRTILFMLIGILLTGAGTFFALNSRVILLEERLSYVQPRLAKIETQQENLEKDLNKIYRDTERVPGLQQQIDSLLRNLQDLRYTVTGQSGVHPPRKGQ